MKNFRPTSLIVVMFCAGLWDGCDRAGAQGIPPIKPQPRQLTNFAQVHSLSAVEARTSPRASLNPWVVAVDEPSKIIILCDATGMWVLKDAPRRSEFRAGQKIQLKAEIIWRNGRADFRSPDWSLQSDVPAPEPLEVGELAESVTSMKWVQAAGVVDFAGKPGQGLALDVMDRGHRLTVTIVPPPAVDVSGLLHRKIQFRGVAQGGITPGGEMQFGRVWVDGLRAIHFTEPATMQDWNAATFCDAAQLTQAATQTNSSKPTVTPGGLVRVAGKMAESSQPGWCRVEDATGSVLVDLPPDVFVTPGESVEVMGIFGASESQPKIYCGYFKATLAGSNSQPLLTTIEQIHRLKPDEADLGLPIRIRGVATGGLAYIQDATRGITVSNGVRQLTFGGYYEIEGRTGSGNYAPLIQPIKITYLGPGQLPEPIHPTWAYLASGSAVCQWLELQGLVLAAAGNRLTLAIPGGRVELQVIGAAQRNLEPFVNSVVRIRGTCRLEYNARRQLTRFWISVPSTAFICEEIPARGDPFDTATRSVSEILQFDVDAYQIRRIKVAGFVTYHAGLTGYVSDGTNNLKYSLQSRARLLPGDRVELVGFPDAGDFSPVLREAISRKTSHEPLETPPLSSYTELAGGEFDSARVRARGRVLAVNVNEAETVLTLLVQSNAVTARVQSTAEVAPPIQIGSIVEVTGVNARRAAGKSSAGAGNAFELLVQSPEDVRVLERPSWWTLQHSLQVISVLGTVLLLALGWIHLLRKKVTERTRQLEAQMQKTERVERKRALEQERSRIARDLHDNLGSCLTEISMLAESGQRSPMPPDDAGNRFGQILDRAHTLVYTLDETVWAVDPAKDTLPSLVRYLAAYAEEFISATGISCRVEVPTTVPELALTTEVRHDLFLATKEALNNAVRHSHAREIQFQIRLSSEAIEITVADDGRGFDAAISAAGNGLNNLRERMGSAGRRCEIQSTPGHGTTVLLSVALPKQELAPLT